LYVGFCKIHTGVTKSIRLLNSHNTLAAIKSLEDVNKVAELRLDLMLDPLVGDMRKASYASEGPQPQQRGYQPGSYQPFCGAWFRGRVFFFL
jgi:hypothetical protein